MKVIEPMWFRAVAVLVLCVPGTTLMAQGAAPAPVAADKVDVAVADALEFLAARQQDSGAWSADQYGDSAAVTSLSVMAFLAAGYLPDDPRYGTTITNGINWVISRQTPEGLIALNSGHGPMYGHGISTLMLAEVVGMMPPGHQASCRTSLENAVRLILRAQSVPKNGRETGGWRYQPTSTDSDLSVTGWLLLALRAAKDAGCDIPAEYIDEAVGYVRRCGVKNGREGFSYQPGGGSSAVRAGIGILSLEVCGEHGSEEAVNAANYLSKRALRTNDGYFFYGAYYHAVGLHKLGGDHWQNVRTKLWPVLLERQQPDGHWLAEADSERRIGPAYCTSLAVLALTVEYGFLPVYQR